MPGKRDKRYYEMHADMCKTIANAKRLQILNSLRTGEMSVSQLAEVMQVREANVSQHLALMRRKGILQTRRDGVMIYYRVADTRVLEAYDLMSQVLQEQLRENALLVGGGQELQDRA